MPADFIALIAFGTDTKHGAHSSLRGFLRSPVLRFSRLGLNIFLSKIFPQRLQSTIFFPFPVGCSPNSHPYKKRGEDIIVLCNIISIFLEYFELWRDMPNG